jgi:hypothetical protein
MRLIFCICAVLCFVMTNYSCHKENQGSTANAAESDSIYIKSIIVIDTAWFGDRDTLFKFYFEYDGSKRISQLKEFGSYDRPTNLFWFKSDVKFTYFGADTLPSVLYSRSSYYADFFDTVYLTYNNGTIIKDSSACGLQGSPPSFFRSNFQDIGGNRLQVMTIDSTQGFPSDMKTASSYVNWVGGNLISEKDTVWVHSMPGIYRLDNKNYIYDQHPNPLRRVLLRFPTTVNYSNWITMSNGSTYLKNFASSSVNNFLTEANSIGLNSIDIVTWNYTYRANGLPEKAIRQSGSAMYKFIYTYTAL